MKMDEHGNFCAQKDTEAAHREREKNREETHT